MGSDIHGFVEKKRQNTEVWLPFAKVFLPAHYEVFARLAGVRGERSSAIVPPRGFPTDASSQAISACTLSIVYSNDQEVGGNAVSFQDAGAWVSRGKSQFFGVMRPVTVTFTPNGGVPETKVYYEDVAGQPARITDPDFHSFTWLTTEEFEHAIRQVTNVPQDYEAVICAMRKLKATDYDVRILLWFDN